MPEAPALAELGNASTSSSDEIVTLVVKHRVKTGLSAQYEAWLRRTVAVAASDSGHLGVGVIRERSERIGMFTSVLRFCTMADMQSWLGSSERQDLLAKAAPMLLEGDFTEVNHDTEFWFAPVSDVAQPPRWKQAVVSFLMICPLTLLIPLLRGPAFRAYPILSDYVLSTVLVTITIVLLVVYVFMPRAIQLLSPWLNAKPKPIHGAELEG